MGSLTYILCPISILLVRVVGLRSRVSRLIYHRSRIRVCHVSRMWPDIVVCLFFGTRWKSCQTCVFSFLGIRYSETVAVSKIVYFRLSGGHLYNGVLGPVKAPLGVIIFQV